LRSFWIWGEEPLRRVRVEENGIPKKVKLKGRWVRVAGQNSSDTTKTTLLRRYLMQGEIIQVAVTCLRGSNDQRF